MRVGTKAWSAVWLGFKLHDRWIMLRIPSRARDYVHRNVTTSSGTHPVFYPVSTLGKEVSSFRGCKAAETWSWPHVDSTLFPRLKTCGAMHLPTTVSSWQAQGHIPLPLPL